MIGENDQLDPTEQENVRSMLDQLLTDSRLYTKSEDYLELLDFVIRLPNFAPFNAMLLQIQKPGLSYAAHAKDWRELFGRYPKEGARPLVIMWPFGPVAFVYDYMDTEGAALPEDVTAFFARGPVNEEGIGSFVGMLRSQQIYWNWIDAGDNSAGSIGVLSRSDEKKVGNTYRVNINRNHPPATQFATLAHELGHLFLGHLGLDPKMKIPDRSQLKHKQEELEAESVSYIVCERNKVESKSKKYLSNYVDENTTIGHIDIYKVLIAAGRIEALLKLTTSSRFDGTAA